MHAPRKGDGRERRDGRCWKKRGYIHSSRTRRGGTRSRSAASRCAPVSSLRICDDFDRDELEVDALIYTRKTSKRLVCCLSCDRPHAAETDVCPDFSDSSAARARTFGFLIIIIIIPRVVLSVCSTIQQPLVRFPDDLRARESQMCIPLRFTNPTRRLQCSTRILCRLCEFCRGQGVSQGVCIGARTV